ncbi:hypothetical protein [Sphingomonas jaspsi]|uniref:hypothetical protein n=1 Tax=Sphingomonas jaspsi TaxID=392409 RepID=UPI0004BBF085|nr:hypothetical protein [Sphingomonas jaspsi]
MASLARVGRRNEIPLSIVEGGSGMIHGVVSEADQKQIPVYAFVNPRHVLRTKPSCPLKTGMVIKTPHGDHFIVGTNGPSEQREGTLWQSWRLFEATQLVHWQRRTQVEDKVTGLKRDGVLQDMGMIWAAVEPLDREVGDFRMSASFEQSRVITGRPIKHDDLIDNRKVSRAEPSLGVIIGVVT